MIVKSLADHKKRRYARPHPATMINIPHSAINAPDKSYRLSFTPSTMRSHISAVTTYTPPYAAYTRPLAVGCSVNNQTNKASDTPAGRSNQAVAPRFNQSQGKKQPIISHSAVMKKSNVVLSMDSIQ
ncbi:hypothetical protein D3C73_1434850 [compost metagenome]